MMQRKPVREFVKNVALNIKDAKTSSPPTLFKPSLGYVKKKCDLIHLLAFNLHEDFISWDEMRKYANDYFHPDHDHFGVLIKTMVKNMFLLHVYKQKTRTDKQETTATYILLVNKNSDLVFKSLDGQIIDEKNILSYLLILIKQNGELQAINFESSLMKYNRIVERPKIEFLEDTIIFITLANDIFRLNNVIALKNRLEKTLQRHFVDFYHIQLSNVKNYADELKRQIDEQKIDLSNSRNIRICLNAHGSAGSNKLRGEYLSGLKKIFTSWDVSTLIDIFLKLGISRDAEIYIDSYACETGASTPKSPAFISHLADSLKSNDFTNVKIHGSKYIVWSYDEPDGAVAKEMEYNIECKTVKLKQS